MTLTKKQKRELALLAELQADHGYMLAKLPSASDRFTTQFSVKKVGNRRVAKMTPAATCRLVVPLASAYGRALADAYNEKSTKRRRK